MHKQIDLKVKNKKVVLKSSVPIYNQFYLLQKATFASQLYSELDNKLWLAEQADLSEMFKIFPASRSDSRKHIFKRQAQKLYSI